MDVSDATVALVADLHRQIDQLKPRGIKNASGNAYNPSYYKRGLANAQERGGTAVAEYVKGYLYRPPSDGYRKLEMAHALDLACEWLVLDESKPYAVLFSDADRIAARERLAPHIAAVEESNKRNRERMAAATAKYQAEGRPRRRSELDDSLGSRRSSDDR